MSIEASTSEKVDFTRTGPDTTAGRYLRSFWHPVCLARDVRPTRAKSVVIMGERVAVFRDRSGRLHAVADRCPHRGSRLSLGWVEDDSLRCRYHGWKFAADGRCVDRPLEREAIPAAACVRAYHAEEYFGLVFLYMGPSPAPPLPRWPELEGAEAFHRVLLRKCNYFLTLENNSDQLHVYYVHPLSGLRDPSWGRAPPSPGARLPTLEVDEQDYGGRYRVIGPDGQLMRTALFLMPTCLYFKSQANRNFLGFDSFIWAVPIDDDSHLVVSLALDSGAGPKRLREQLLETNKTPELEGSDRLDIDAVLSGAKEWDELPQKSHVVFIEDAIVLEALGPQVARDEELLGRSDKGVALLRKMWRRELKALAAGLPAKRFAPPEKLGEALRSIDPPAPTEGAALAESGPS